MPLPGFEKGVGLLATAIAFSPDGSTLYIACVDQRVYATSSIGHRWPAWWEPVLDTDICDIAVSPDGLSVSLRFVICV